MDINDKLKLAYRIKEINKVELHKSIFKLLLMNSMNYTQNNNGIYFNISKLNDVTLYEIDSIVKEYEITIEEEQYNKLVK